MANSDFDLRHQNQRLDSKIVASLERIAQAYRVLLWQESKEYSLSPIQVQVLIFLLYHDEKKCLVSYLADEFNMTKATMSDSVKTLEQKGLISKEYQTHDARSFLIYLTNNGKQVAKKASLFTTEIRKPIEQMDQGNKENLLLSLLETIQHLNQAGVITIQRMCQTCQFYAHGNQHSPHCTLLNRPLKGADHRIDCPDHKLST